MALFGQYCIFKVIFGQYFIIDFLGNVSKGTFWARFHKGHFGQDIIIDFDNHLLKKGALS